MPIPVDPGVAVAHTAITAAAINARFAPLYNTLTPASVGIDDSNVKAAGLTDVSLASPTSPAWRTVFSTIGVVPAALVTTGVNYFFGTSPGNPAASGAAAASLGGLWIPQAAADVAVAGKTTRLRLRVCVGVNATTPNANYVWALYPVSGSFTGGSGVIAPTLGAAVGTVTSASPTGGAAQMTAGTSFDFSTTVGGVYLPGVSVSAIPTAASLVAFQLFLEMRHT